MSANVLVQKARVILETEDAVYDLPTYGLDGRPAPLSLTPQEPFDQINIVGDTSKVADRRATQIIPATQVGGAGRNRYNETEGVTDYRQSDANTRHDGVIVCRPKRTSLGTASDSPDGNMVVKYVGYSGAKYHLWGYDGTLSYHPGTGTTWTSTGFTTVKGHVQGMGYTFINPGSRVSRTVDGINFTNMASGNFAFTAKGLTIHDSKLWTVLLNTTDNTADLYASTNATHPTATSVTWTKLAGTPMFHGTGRNEEVVDLIAWKDASGSPALYILTTQRLLVYNPIGQTIEEYDSFADNNPEGSGTVLANYGIGAIVFKTSGDLYSMQGQETDYLMRYSPGAGFGRATPNRYGGLENDRQGSPRALAQNAYGLGVWTSPATNVGLGGGGAAWFVDAQGGWHCLNRDLSGNDYPIVGGGIGDNKFFTIFQTGGGSFLVEWQPLRNVGSAPQFATGQKYDTQYAQVHEYAESDGGTSLLPSTLHGFTLDTTVSDGTDLPGLDASGTVKVEYNLDGAGWNPATQYRDANGVLRTAASGNYTAALTDVAFPIRIVLNDEFGLPCYRFRWRVTLSTSDEDETPVVLTCAPRLTKTPPPHYNYEFVTDLSAFQRQGGLGPGGVMPMPNGRSAGALHNALEVIDQLGVVKLTYGVGGEQRSDFCEFAMAPQLHPQAGVGRYRISLKSIRSDPSG